MAQSSAAHSQDTVHKLTVARVQEKYHSEYARVTFYESARFYKLMKSNKKFDEYLPLLKTSEKEGLLLCITFIKDDSDIIDKVERVSTR